MTEASFAAESHKICDISLKSQQFSCSMIILTHHIQFATEDLTNSGQNVQEQGGE